MSAIHDRWELVEPLLFAHPLRDHSAFARGESDCTFERSLESLRHERRFDEPAIAQAVLHLNASCALAKSAMTPIHKLLREQSASWLIADGDHWSLRSDVRRPGQEIVRWRGITMLLPSSIVIAGALAEAQILRPCRVQVLPDSIAPQHEVAHLHVHLGPMLPFESLWMQLWNAFLWHGTLDARRGGGIAAVRAVPAIGRCYEQRNHGRNWQWLLELAFAARVWLAERDFVAAIALPAVLREFGRGEVDLATRARSLVALWGATVDAREDRRVTDATIWRDLARRDGRQRAEQARERERQSVRAHRSRTGACVADRGCDASLLSDSDEEVAFLARAIRRSERDAEYARVLYQYLRVKVALYSSLVVDPWSVGLRHFLDVVQLDSPYLEAIDDDDHLEHVRWASAHSESPLEIAALEVHVPPSKWLKRHRYAPRPEAWVLSFVRAERPKHDDSGGIRASRTASRGWRRTARQADTTCRLVARCITSRPSLLREIRALSLMDWERNGPVWLFERPFRRVIDVSAHVAARHSGQQLRPLRTALHLGEDFDHLLSGLRQIYEPFFWQLIRSGDRLGHALALGLEPEDWCKENPFVRMRPWDRLLDLGFVYWGIDKLGISCTAGTLEGLRLSASEAIRAVCGRSDPGALETARETWLSLPTIPVRQEPRGRTGAGLDASRPLVGAVLDDYRIGESALSSSLVVETKNDLPLLKAIHDIVMQVVASAQVVVEVNPSSNLLVGGFRSIFNQPAFHSDDLPITLGADDPLTFATTLADEYAYAWAGMVVGSGQPPHQATKRLDEAARCSMRFAFDRKGVQRKRSPRQDS